MAEAAYVPLNGTEMIQFNTANPSPAANFNLSSPGPGNSFDPASGFWTITGPVEFSLWAPGLGTDWNPGVIFMMQGAYNCAPQSFSAQIKVGDTLLSTNFPKRATQRLAFYIPPSMLTLNAVNRITFTPNVPFSLSACSITIFRVQQQQQSNWCWAAVAASVSNYYSGGSSEQCAVVNTQLTSRSCDCCANKVACNQGGNVLQALYATGNAGPMGMARMPGAAIAAQMIARQPIVANIQWNMSADNSGAHSLLISGISADQTMIEVQDPLYGISYVNLAAFPSNYQSLDAKWTAFVLTNPRYSA